MMSGIWLVNLLCDACQHEAALGRRGQLSCHSTSRESSQVRSWQGVKVYGRSPPLCCNTERAHPVFWFTLDTQWFCLISTVIYVFHASWYHFCSNMMLFCKWWNNRIGRKSTYSHWFAIFVFDFRNKLGNEIFLFATSGLSPLLRKMRKPVGLYMCGGC